MCECLLSWASVIVGFPPGTDSWHGAGIRMYSERNLARVLNELDLARPSDSPLLRADSNHGGLNRAIFYGPAGEKQRKTLSDWVRAVAKEQQLAQKQQERRPSVTKKSSPARSSAALDQALVEPESDTPPRMASITKASAPAEDQDDTQVDALIQRSSTENITVAPGKTSDSPAQLAGTVCPERAVAMTSKTTSSLPRCHAFCDSPSGFPVRLLPDCRAAVRCRC